MIDTSYMIAGAITGFIVGLTGVGGGALMTPILLIVFGVSPVKAIATDLWFAAITKMVGAYIHQGHGQVDWQVVKRLWLGSLPVALGTVIYVSLQSEIAKVDWLTDSVGILVLITGVGMLFSPLLTKLAKNRKVEQSEKMEKTQAKLTIGAGAILGICVALTSVGAGALGSVMLLYLYPYRMTPHKMVATDLMHAIPLAVVAGSGYLAAGLVDYSMLISLLCGSIPAIIAGSFLTKRVPGKALKIILSVVLVSAGLKTLMI